MNVCFLTIIHVHYWDELLELDCLILEASRTILAIASLQSHYCKVTKYAKEHHQDENTLTRHIACITTITTAYLLTTIYHQLVVTVVSLETNHCLVSTNSVCEIRQSTFICEALNHKQKLCTLERKSTAPPEQQGATVAR